MYVRYVETDTLTTEKLVEESLLLRKVRKKTSQKEKALIPKNQGFVDHIKSELRLRRIRL